jgi:hypothetical protein
MRRVRFIASAILVAAALPLGGCDWGKLFSFGYKSDWEIPENNAAALAPHVRAGEVVAPPVDGRKFVCQDGSGTRIAYIRATPDNADREVEHIFIESGGRTWEILGLPHTGKPLEDLHWEGQMLVVDRWRTPTDGVRIYIDSNQGRGTMAQAITRDAPPATQATTKP